MIGNALKLIQWLYEQDKEQLFTIKKYKKKRNKDQNAKYWKLIGELSLKTKIGIEELHFQMLKFYSPRYQILVPSDEEVYGIEYYDKKSKIRNEEGKEFNVYYVYKPSHELNETEFSILLDGLCNECKEQGIETRSPEEILRDNQLNAY